MAVQLLICDLTFVLYPSYVPPHYVMQYIDSVDKHSATHSVIAQPALAYFDKTSKMVNGL